MNWTWAFEQLCSDRKVVRECHQAIGKYAYVYRRGIPTIEQYDLHFVRLNNDRSVIYEMRWKADYDDLVATDWKLYDEEILPEEKL